MNQGEKRREEKRKIQQWTDQKKKKASELKRNTKDHKRWRISHKMEKHDHQSSSAWHIVITVI